LRKTSRKPIAGINQPPVRVRGSKDRARDGVGEGDARHALDKASPDRFERGVDKVVSVEGEA